MTDVDRREFIMRSARYTGSALIAPSLAGLVACGAEAAPTKELRASGGEIAIGAGAYGTLAPHPRYPEIALPPGFDALLISQAGDLMSDGHTVPSAFDGMGAFRMSGDRVRLVRNHEMRDPPGAFPPLSPAHAYDSKANAGNSTIELGVRPDGSVVVLRQWVSLSGTSVNCAGGVTPWGSWLACEETTAGIGAGWGENHGYVFEIPASADAPVTPVPLKAMGRFVHEAVAVTPWNGVVYETEDANASGFYRFIPNVSGDLRQGGRLQILAIQGAPNYDTRTRQIVGAAFDCTWLDIDAPDSSDPYMPGDFVYAQGFTKGAAQFARLEGCWFGDDSIYFNATSGGNAGAGQVWRYMPNQRGGKLILVFESPSPAVLSSPDNICVSPRGGLVICEDGDGTNYVRGITREGHAFDLARNNVNDSEWAGACFSPQGRTLFVNIQGSTSHPLDKPAMTWAIWGPWQNGAL